MSAADPMHLLRLQAWLSPSFPVGGFSYSHGLEQAVEAGWVHDATTLRNWLETDLRHGAGRSDGILLSVACRALSGPRPDWEGFLETAELAEAMRGTAELALETTAQGISFLATIRKAWSHPLLDELAARLHARDIRPSYPVALGAACAAHGIPEAVATRFMLHASVANYVGAALRLLRLGQTEGQRILAALEPALMDAARDAETGGLDDVGSASLSIDIASMRHETQYSRLFRS